jgi:signal peptidase I
MISVDDHRLGSDGVGQGPPMFNAVAHWTKYAAVAFVLLLIIRAFFVEAFKVPTGSMGDTLLAGDFMLLN